MDFKGYRLWATGQLDSTCRAPPLPRTPGSQVNEAEPERKGPAGGRDDGESRAAGYRGVALQVVYLKGNL
jgi:hypothetical protein